MIETSRSVLCWKDNALCFGAKTLLSYKLEEGWLITDIPGESFSIKLEGHLPDLFIKAFLTASLADATDNDEWRPELERIYNELKRRCPEVGRSAPLARKVACRKGDRAQAMVEHQGQVGRFQSF